MTEPLRWGHMQYSSVQLLDDPPVLEAWRKDLLETLRYGAEREGYRPVGEATIHEPEPQWWVDVPDPITGEATSMLVGRHMAQLGENDELGQPAALAWRCEVDVEPIPSDERTPGDTDDEG